VGDGGGKGRGGRGCVLARVVEQVVVVAVVVVVVVVTPHHGRRCDLSS